MKVVDRIARTALFFALLSGLAWAQEQPRESVINAMRDGGFAIVMRHASSPRQAPGEEARNSDNAPGERQLDENGRASSQAMGEALRRLGIHIEQVASSPTYRAMETARHMGYETVEQYAELGTAGMRESTTVAAEWLKQKLSEPLEAGNLLVISHAPVIGNAFPEEGRSMEDGEALIFDPRGQEGPAFVTKIRVDEWPDF